MGVNTNDLIDEEKIGTIPQSRSYIQTDNLRTDRIAPQYEEVRISHAEKNLFFGSESLEPKNTGDNNDLVTVLLCLALGILFIIISTIKDAISKRLRPFVSRRLRDVSRDVMIVMVIITLILWIDYQDYDIMSLDISGICLAWSIGILVWFFYCAFLTIICHLFSKNIEQKEEEVYRQGNLLIILSLNNLT